MIAVSCEAAFMLLLSSIIKWYQFEGLNTAQIHKCSYAHKFERLEFRLYAPSPTTAFFLSVSALRCVLNLKMFIDND
jgi:hypothetical protein